MRSCVKKCVSNLTLNSDNIVLSHSLHLKSDCCLSDKDSLIKGGSVEGGHAAVIVLYILRQGGRPAEAGWLNYFCTLSPLIFSRQAMYVPYRY